MRYDRKSVIERYLRSHGWYQTWGDYWVKTGSNQDWGGMSLEKAFDTQMKARDRLLPRNV